MNAGSNSTSRSFASGGVRVAVLIGMAAAAVGIALCVPPRPQAQGYHNFADRRTILGVANFLDVASNVPFALVGAVGVGFLARGAVSARRGDCGVLAWEDRLTFGVMFAGLFLTALGSAYYHLAPDNARLFWDRLPMAVAFMGKLAGMIAERISRRAGARLLAPLVLAGAAAVIYWRLTEARGAGDLRFYMLVQIFPLAVVPYVALAFRPRYLAAGGMLIALGWYVLAKVLEYFDAQIYAVGGILSGHTLKHLAAALGAAWILRAMMIGAARRGGGEQPWTR